MEEKQFNRTAVLITACICSCRAVNNAPEIYGDFGGVE